MISAQARRTREREREKKREKGRKERGKRERGRGREVHIARSNGKEGGPLARASADGDGGGSGDGGGGGIGMQPSEEFRPLPHIYLNARHGAVARRQRDLGRARSAGPPFIVRQPRGFAREEGVQIKERGSEVTERNRERESEKERERWRRTENTYEASAKPLLRP